MERYPAVRVLCVGDVMLDRFVYGAVTRISPEAPIPVVSVQEEISMLGGAGNVARNIASLGSAVDFVTVIGCDAAGEEVERELAQLKNCTPRIARDASRRTSVKIRYLAHQQQILRVDSESTEPLSDPCFAEVAARFRDALPACHAVLLSDYAKGVLRGARAPALIQMSRAAGKPVLVDPKGPDLGRYRGATLVKPNLAELREASRMPAESAEQVETAARSVLDAAGIGAMLVTRGAAGMMLVRPGMPVFEIRGGAREVFDVSGAGDTAAANLAVAFAAGAPLEDAVRLANIAAGLVVAKLGTATVTRDQLVFELRAETNLTPGDKIRDCDSAMDQIAKWRRTGLRVRSLAGRFDQPQSELFDLLRNTRAQCEKLVLAVVTEDAEAPDAASAAALRELLAALVWVDLVVSCGADRAARFVTNADPDN